MTAYLGYRQIDLSAKVLAVLMIAEIAVLAVLDIAVIVSKGVHAVPIESLAPHNVFGGAVGVTMMFAFMSFIGFESAALYGEETKDPRRSVPLATYASVIVIAAFYALTSWVAVGGVGKDQLQEVAGQQLGDLFFQLSTTYVSSDLTTVMQILLCTSLLAASLALHNATNRYTFVLGRERVLPGWLGQPHPRFHSPHRAGLVQVVVSAIVVAAFAVAGLDPYTSLCTSLLGLGTLGIVVIQAAAAFSVIGFFRNRADRHWWRTLLAPLLGAAGLTTASLLLIEKFSLLTGTTNPVINALPWVLLIAAGGGVGYARWLKAGRPERYAAIAQVEIREDADVPVPMIVADRDPVPVA